MNLIDAGPLRIKFVRPRSNESNRLVLQRHVLGRSGGFRLQSALWGVLRNGLVTAVDFASAESLLAEGLMARYQDHPMDLADATLDAVADIRGWRRVFTLDSHFFSYRLRDESALEVILPSKA